MAWTKKKKKRIIGLVAAVACCAGLFTAYALLSDYNKEQLAEEETSAAETEHLFEFKSTDICKVRFVTEEADLTFSRADSESDWVYEGDKKLPVVQSDITRIVAAGTALIVYQEIADNLDNAAAFGLDDPAYQVYFTDANGTEYALNIGDTTVTNSSWRYANVQGTTRIVTVADTLVNRIGGDLYAFIDVGEYPEFKMNDMTQIVYNDARQTLKLINNPADLRESEAIGTSQWYYIVEGGYQACDYDNSAKFVNTVVGITFESCVNYEATDEELKQYGLAEPVATLQVDYVMADEDSETVETTFVLNIGKATEDGESYYVNVDDSRCVYLVEAETVELFTENVLTDYLISKSPFLINFNGIKRIVAEHDGKTLEIEVEQSKGTDGDGEEITVYNCKVNGEDYEEKSTRSVFANLIRPMADHILADGEAKEDSEVLFRSTYYTNYEEKPEITFEISEFDSTYYQVSVNGNTKYAITKQEYNALLSNLEGFLK